MKTLFLAALLSTSLAHADGAAEFRGYTAINRRIKDRIARVNGFELGMYLSEVNAEPAPDGLLSLLGTYLGSDTDAQFRNGQPNPLNLILWYVALTGLSRDIAAYCDPAQPAPAPGLLGLRPAFAAALHPLCAWPKPEAKTRDVMLGYWIALVGFDVPWTEFEAWQDFFTRTAPFATDAALPAVTALTLAALYNPYFLLGD